MTDDSSLFLNMPSILSTNVFDRDVNNRFRLPLHKHDNFCEMLLVAEGEGTFGINGSTYHAGAETLLFYQPGVWHEELSTKHPFKALYVGYRGLQLYGLPPDCFLDPGGPQTVKLHMHALSVKQQMMEIHSEFNQKRPEAHVIANQLLGILLARLAQQVYYESTPETAVKPSIKAVHHAIRYMEENYRYHLKLETLASVTHVNPYHLAHLFKNETGTSPIRYLIRYRMEVAKRYLHTTQLTIREIGELVGYESETSFQNLFKRVTGMTPGQYRSDYREQGKWKDGD